MNGTMVDAVMCCLCVPRHAHLESLNSRTSATREWPCRMWARVGGNEALSRRFARTSQWGLNDAALKGVGRQGALGGILGASAHDQAVGGTRSPDTSFAQVELARHSLRECWLRERIKRLSLVTCSVRTSKRRRTVLTPAAPTIWTRRERWLRLSERIRPELSVQFAGVPIGR